MKLSPSQVLVRALYADGEFSYVNTRRQLGSCGDTLFEFLMLEAYDAESVEEFRGMLDTAIGQLRALKDDLL